MKRLFLVMLILFSVSTVQKAEAKGVIIYGLGETISKTQTLPDDVVIDGEHVNIGVLYEQFSLFWMPIWNYGEVTNVLINDKEDTYWEISDEDIEDLKTEFNVEIAEAAIPFWTRVGAKPIIILLVLFLFFRSRFVKA